MMSDNEHGSLGSHPDRRNWKPAESLDEYVRNCREGLETYSGRRAAKLLGWNRGIVWRAKKIAELPKDLFEALTELDEPPSVKEMAAVSQALSQGERLPAPECCPHCGVVLRQREAFSASVRDAVNQWAVGRACD